MRNLSTPLSSTWGDDDDDKKGKKDKTISLSGNSTAQRQFSFENRSELKASKSPIANSFINDKEAKNMRSSLAKDLRTGKISKADYDKGMRMARTKNDIKNLEKNAGGSGAKSNFRGSKCSMTAETRSRSCSKPGKGF